MIVYGDPSTQESFRTLVERLEKSLSAARPGSLDDARSLLIQAGMLEQAVEDGAPEWAEPCRRLTDALAEAFVSKSPLLPSGEEGAGGGEVSKALAEFLAVPDLPLTVKLPEGFAFYALYPEAYAHAALAWLREEPLSRVVRRGGGAGVGDVLVLGVRSIGTTLSAVVAATLRAEGVAARRLTVRPTGHPFHREAAIAPQKAHHALVVDEGPGLSGSSMAAAAEAACRAGIPRGRVAFLPGHGGEPGLQASEATLAWWAAAPRYVTPTEALRPHGQTLEETLAEGGAVEELSGGHWRELVYRDEDEWPPIDAPFERRKLLVRHPDGTALLWKFVGLTEPLFPPGERGRGRGSILGFAPAPWIEGAPLTPADATPEILAGIGHHIAATAGPPLSPEEAQAAHDRLAHMIHWNAKEAFGWEPLPLGRGRDGVNTALDDRLAPHEWRRLPGGVLKKVGDRPPAGDHTVVGRQPTEWAVAAAMVEWNLDEPHALGIPTDPEALRFHRAAYAAFRLGMTVHCKAGAAPAELKRLERAEARYRNALEGALRAGTRSV